MRVGILTLYPTHNYGGILQCIALYHLLKENGHEPILIYRPQYTNTFLKKVIKEILKYIPYQNIKNIRQVYLDSKKHKPFIEKFIPNKTKKYSNANDLITVCSDYDLEAIIVGSDQVWRYSYINDGHFKNFFLDFVTDVNIKKIAFSASFGKDIWEDKESIPEVKYLINKFDYISVRENSGVDICSEIFNFNMSEHTLDPTMLVDKAIYDQIIRLSNNSNLYKNKLVTYILDETLDKKNIVEEVATEKNLEIFNLHGFGTKNIFVSVPDWCAAIKNADFVITDSFHGMVFSILFNKQFLVIGNKNRGLSRFSSLLNICGLSDRMIFEMERDTLRDIVGKEINYVKVNHDIDIFDKKSKAFLINALNSKL